MSDPALGSFASSADGDAGLLSPVSASPLVAALTGDRAVLAAILAVEAGWAAVLEKAGLAPAGSAAIVASANDAAVALAEKLAGSEEAFAVRMTAMARELGMARTVFRNASGLPHDGQVTTARDMAVLATALLRDYPKHYPLFNQRAVTIGKRSRGTVNSILGSYAGADGFKTGFTCGSGYNLVASATRDGRRVIGVVLGSSNRGQRTIEMTGLLNRAFSAGASKGATLAELGHVVTTADSGPAPIILSGGKCTAAVGEDRGTITSAARLSGWGIVFGPLIVRLAKEALEVRREAVQA